jgi:hypothetical protein
MQMQMDQSKARAENQLNLVYERMFQKVRECAKEYAGYKKVSEIENLSKEVVIKR